MSGGGSLAFVSGEAGVIFAVDTDSGEVHAYKFVAYGVGLGLGGAATGQIGVMDMDDPKDITGPGMEAQAFAAAGKGVTAQASGSPAYSAAGAAGGYAAGYGFGISGMGTYTWYKGKYNLKDLPEDILNKLRPYLPELLKLDTL